VIEAVDNRLSWVADGVVRSDDSLRLSERLAQLHRGVAAILGEFAPAEAALEETFVNKNPSSTLKLGQARGAVMAALGLAGLMVAEYAPRLVKKSLVGTGAAAKDQVGMMVRHLLPGCRVAQADAADALAVAICHAHHRGTTHRISLALEAGR